MISKIISPIFLWCRASKEDGSKYKEIGAFVGQRVASNPGEREKQLGPKCIFVSFATEDKHQLDLLKNQSLKTKKKFKYICMSADNVDTPEWKESVRTEMQHTDGVLVLVSKNSLRSNKQKKELSIAKEDNKRMLGIWTYSHDRTKLKGIKTVPWTSDAIRKFIDRPITVKNVLTDNVLWDIISHILDFFWYS